MFRLFKTEKEGSKWDKYFGEQIRTAREERNMSQDELARAIYKNRATISDYERGRTGISAFDLMGIAHALGKPILYFYPKFPSIQGIKEEELDLSERELIHFFRQIQSEQGEKLAIKQVARIADIAADLDILQTD